MEGTLVLSIAVGLSVFSIVLAYFSLHSRLSETERSLDAARNALSAIYAVSDVASGHVIRSECVKGFPDLAGAGYESASGMTLKHIKSGFDRC